DYYCYSTDSNVNGLF
nr:immunoglobulin light chain junction region [Macaca mulatta]MOW03079.1 immunoglobulin light chain junction region [Macaca mulatta]